MKFRPMIHRRITPQRLAKAIGLGLCLQAISLSGSAQSYYLLTSDSSLAQVLESQPNMPSAAVPVAGLNPGDQLVAIDVRPQTGRLYGLGQNPKTGSAQLYILEMGRSGASAIAIGSTGSFVNAAGNPMPLFANGFDMDFNPTVDRIRVVASNGMNFRMNPNDGAFVDGNLGGAAGSIAGLNPDAALNGGATQGMGTAYSNNEANAALTTQFTLDSSTNALYIQQPPNAGTLINSVPIMLGSNVLDFPPMADLILRQASMPASVVGRSRAWQQQC
ncbi:DUF4394 domain-containing protein [bacterium]|nr:DUF4394 domain-containing protein [bacterium]